MARAEAQAAAERARAYGEMARRARDARRYGAATLLAIESRSHGMTLWQGVAKIDNSCHTPENGRGGGVVNVSLTRELEKLINEKVASGRYQPSSEVVREALRLLEERDRLRLRGLEDLRREVRKGLESGPGIPAEDVFSDLRERARKARRKAR